MKCQQCHQAEATVHLKEVTEGKLREFHLCEGCANEKGLHLVVEQNKLTIATQFIWMAENLYPETSAKVGAVQCSVCGLRYSQFSRVGRLGCPDCYDAFQTQLQKILLRVHGATRHRGRLPAYARPAGEAPAADTAVEAPPETEAPAERGEGDRTADLAELRRRLRRAVEAEAYEDAARLRDEIRRLEGGRG